MKTSRRKFLSHSLLTAAGMGVGLKSLQAENTTSLMTAEPGTDAYSISVFSKNLHWLDYEGMSKAAADMGFDSIDLTVRPEGHVLPVNVREDLPKATAAMKKAGLKPVMITTAIVRAEDPFTEDILKTASESGFHYYRMGWIPYNEKLGITENLDVIMQQLQSLEKLNKKYGIRGQYQNHSGTSFGSPVWDLGSLLEKIASPWIGSQFDILHATIEGGNSWPLGMKLVHPYIGSLDIKDFEWRKVNSQWKSVTVPLGEGMIDYKKYFAQLKALKIAVPFSIHYEYPLGGAENGAKVITMDKAQVLSAMQKDLLTLKRWINESGLRAG